MDDEQAPPNALVPTTPQLPARTELADRGLALAHQLLLSSCRENEWLKEIREKANAGDALAQWVVGIEYKMGGSWVAQSYECAVQWFRKAAEQGHARAQRHLGLAYLHGTGVSEDHAQAVMWFRKAADGGNSDAYCNLGLAYENGLGVPQDYAQAVEWYRKGAEHGDQVAQNNLGVMYDWGRGVPEDEQEAASWFRKAADQGDATAQSNLALAYSTGRGVPQDYVEAHKWMDLAVACASPEEDREAFSESLDAISKQMTPEQLAEAQKRARELIEAFQQRRR